MIKGFYFFDFVEKSFKSVNIQIFLSCWWRIRNSVTILRVYLSCHGRLSVVFSLRTQCLNVVAFEGLKATDDQFTSVSGGNFYFVRSNPGCSYSEKKQWNMGTFLWWFFPIQGGFEVNLLSHLTLRIYIQFAKCVSICLKWKASKLFSSIQVAFYGFLSENISPDIFIISNCK